MAVGRYTQKRRSFGLHSMSPRDSSIAAIVAFETILVFLLGIFSSKIASSINIPPTTLLIVTLFGIIGVAYVSYKKYTFKSTDSNTPKPSDKSLRSNIVRDAVQRRTFLNPRSKSSHLSSSQVDEMGDAALTRSIRLSVIVGAILFPLIHWLNNRLVAICILSAITIDFISIIPILKLPSNEEGFGRLYEVFGLLFLTCIVSFMVGLFSLAFVLICARFAGIEI